MKKLLPASLVLAVLLSGCAGRGSDKQAEDLGENTIRPLELTEDEEALLDLIGGSGTEYSVYQLTAGETITGGQIEVLSWENGSWRVTGGGTAAISGPSDQLRLGIVLGAEDIRINWQDGSSQFSVTTSLGEIDRSTGNGSGRTWLEEAQALTPGERTPLYLEVYQKDGEDGLSLFAPPDGFFDPEYLNSLDRAYAVTITLEE